MDRAEHIVWIVLIVSLVSFSLFVVVYGEDKIETMKVFHKDNPSVCIFEPEQDLQDRFHSTIFKHTVDSVLIWQNEMKSYSGGNWYMPIFYYQYGEHVNKTPQEFPECNILIVFEGLNNGTDIVNSSALGYAHFDFSHSNHQWAMVVVYTKALVETPVVSVCIGCDDVPNEINIKQEVRDLPENSIRYIIMHEFGHALGIGHYVDDRTKFNNHVSLMYPSMSPFGENDLTIGFVDKEVLVKIYNIDGFKGIYGHTPDRYIIKEKSDGTGFRLGWDT